MFLYNHKHTSYKSANWPSTSGYTGKFSLLITLHVASECQQYLILMSFDVKHNINFEGGGQVL